MARDPRATDSTPQAGRRLGLAALVVVALVALVTWTFAGGGDDGGSTASGDSGTPTATSSSTPSSTPSNAPPSSSSRPDTSRGPSRTATPGKTAESPGATATASATPKVVAAGKPQRTLRTRLDRSRQLGNGVAVEVVTVESVRGKGRGIGEVSGPAVRLTVQVQNRTAKSLPLDLALITMYYGPQDTPASELSGPGVRRLPSRLAPDGTATGTYVFGVPRGARGAVRVDFTYSTRAPRVVFRGAADGTT